MLFLPSPEPASPGPQHFGSSANFNLYTTAGSGEGNNNSRRGTKRRFFVFFRPFFFSTFIIFLLISRLLHKVQLQYPSIDVCVFACPGKDGVFSTFLELEIICVFIFIFTIVMRRADVIRNNSSFSGFGPFFGWECARSWFANAFFSFFFG